MQILFSNTNKNKNKSKTNNKQNKSKRIIKNQQQQIFEVEGKIQGSRAAVII